MKRGFAFGPGTDLDDLNEQIKRMTNNYALGFSYTVDRINNILVVDDGAPERPVLTRFSGVHVASKDCPCGNVVVVEDFRGT